MNAREIRDVIVLELSRQAEEDRAGTPYFDFSPTEPIAIIDGEVDLDKLAEAIERAFPETIP